MENPLRVFQQQRHARKLPQLPPCTPVFLQIFRCLLTWFRNWEFFRQQWEDFEVAAGLDKQDSKITLASLRSVMGKECRQKFLNLSISDENRKNVQTCLTTLENYFKPQRNVVYERYVFNSCKQNPGGSVDSYVARLRKVNLHRLTNSDHSLMNYSATD